MAVKSLEKKNIKELIKDLKQKREFIRDFNFAVSGSKTNKPHEFKNNKKEIAQILTELKSRKNEDK